MRVKQLWNYLPLPSKLKLLASPLELFSLTVANAISQWDRITLSRITTLYFIFSVLHCISQVAFQIRAFTINVEAATFLSGISKAGNAVDDRIPAISSNDVRLCPDVPRNPYDISACAVIWDGQPKNNSLVVGGNVAVSSTLSLATTPSSTTSSLAAPTITSTTPGAVRPVIVTNLVTAAPATSTVVVLVAPTAAATVGNTETEDSDDDDDDDAEDDLDDRAFTKRAVSGFSVLAVNDEGDVTVNISGLGYNNESATLSKSCLWSLNWPVSILDNTKREDIVFIAFQFWVLGMSVVALLNESIPHVFASLFTHVLATAWSGFQINHTNNFRKSFNWAITNGACRGISLLPNYWEERAKAEYPALALNCLSLLISAFLTWKLVKLFGWQTFKRVGASLSINRMYKIVLSLSICLQLGFFFITVMVGLWLDSLFNGLAAQVAWYVPLYKATSIVTLVLLLPWLLSGWYAVRAEKRLLMFVFLALSLIYLAGWSVMFTADTFRWLFVQWRFFSLMAAASVVMTLSAFILGVLCRYNFGKGLPRYLNAQEPLPGDDFQPVVPDLEKVAFPSNEKPMPTYSAAFGSGDEVPPPSQMFAASRMGPRFFNPSAQPFEAPREISAPATAMVRPPAYEADRPIQRSDSAKSANSIGSIASYYSYSNKSSHSRSDTVDSNGRRWLIE